MEILKAQFEAQGYVVVRDLVPQAITAEIAQTLGCMEVYQRSHVRGKTVYAGRDVFATEPRLLAFASGGPMLELARLLGGSKARPTKATFFDKREGANWTLPLHQDLTITVRNRADVPGYTHWSTKAGAPHVQPPVEILERIVALRLHLDDCPVENGALEVVPGSHRLGRIGAAALRVMHLEGKAVACPAKAGDVLAMRPLLVHGSRKALIPGRRRVLHIEYCAAALEPPLEWPAWPA